MLTHTVLYIQQMTVLNYRMTSLAEGNHPVTSWLTSHFQKIMKSDMPIAPGRLQHFTYELYHDTPVQQVPRMYTVDDAYVQYGTCTCFGKKREGKLTMQIPVQVRPVEHRTRVFLWKIETDWREPPSSRREVSLFRLYPTYDIPRNKLQSLYFAYEYIYIHSVPRTPRVKYVWRVGPAFPLDVPVLYRNITAAFGDLQGEVRRKRTIRQRSLIFIAQRTSTIRDTRHPPHPTTTASTYQLSTFNDQNDDYLPMEILPLSWPFVFEINVCFLATFI